MEPLEKRIDRFKAIKIMIGCIGDLYSGSLKSSEKDQMMELLEECTLKRIVSYPPYQRGIIKQTIKDLATMYDRDAEQVIRSYVRMIR